MRVVAIGISPNRSGAGRGVPFAASDAERLANLCGPEATAICESAATVATVRRSLEKHASGDADDPDEDAPVFVVLITAARLLDGRMVLELADGPVDSRDLLTSLWTSGRTRIVVGFDLTRGYDRLPAGWNEAVENLAGALPIGPGRTLLFSAGGEEISRVSGELQAGIWAYHLAAAVGGRDERARELDGRLTASSLGSYLPGEMDGSLQRAFLEPIAQTPQILAHNPDELLAEAIVEPTPPPRPEAGTGLELRREELIPVSQLGGFRKGIHKVPGDALAASRAWVRQLAGPDLHAAVEETAAGLRREMGYRRRQLRTSTPVQGEASIMTPDFVVHFSASQVAEAPGMALIRRTLLDIADPAKLGWESLAAVFPRGFTSLHQRSTAPTDIAALIDLLEEGDWPAIGRIDYPTNLDYCELTLAGLAGVVRIDTEGMTLVSDGPLRPGELLRLFATVREILS